MGIESATHIDDFVLTNPAGTDDRSTVDDHIRMIKTVLQTDFSAITGAVTSTHLDLNLLSGSQAAGLTTAEIEYLIGVTSAIQTQIDTKAPTAGPAFTGTVKFAKGADLGTADVTTGILTVGTDGNYFDFTDTDTILGIATVGVGTVIKLHFDAALTLTHHATNLYLNSGAGNILTAAGDEAELIEYATGDWRLLSYRRSESRKTYYAYTHTSDVAVTATAAATPDAIGAGVAVTIPTKGRIKIEKMTIRLLETAAATAYAYLLPMLSTTGYTNNFLDAGSAASTRNSALVIFPVLGASETDSYTDFPADALSVAGASIGANVLFSGNSVLDIESSGITTGAQTLVIGACVKSGDAYTIKGTTLTTEFVISIEDMTNESVY